MKLQDLLVNRSVGIQCHDAPDADALASGYALYAFFKAHGKEVAFFYGGREAVSKPNLVLMMQRLDIPAQYAGGAQLPACDLVIYADCQPGERNVSPLPWPGDPDTAVIDHHQTRLENGPRVEIQSHLGSCATVVWRLLREAGFSLAGAECRSLRTALYYGLYTDTCEFKELTYPLDRDMRDHMLEDKIDKYVFDELLSNNIQPEDMERVGRALASYIVLKEFRTAVIPVEVSDPNILGITGDFLEQVAGIDLCVSFCRLAEGKYKLSVRSASEHTHANDYLEYVCGPGASGGHKTKAGGVLLAAGDPVEAITQRTKDFFAAYPVVTAGQAVALAQPLGRFRKKAGLRQAVRSTDIFPAGTPFFVRELEGDFSEEAAEDLFIVVGLSGEVYYMKEDRFRALYQPADQPGAFLYEYTPTIKNLLTGESIPITRYAGVYRTVDRSQATAGELPVGVRMRAPWSAYEYLRGSKGDYIVFDTDPGQAYVVKRAMFEKIYEVCDAADTPDEGGLSS